MTLPHMPCPICNELEDPHTDDSETGLCYACEERVSIKVVLGGAPISVAMAETKQERDDG